MKTRILFTMLMLLFPMTKVVIMGQMKYEGDSIVEVPIVKETKVFIREAETMDKRIVCERNEHNQLLSKIVYVYNDNREWIPSQKYLYNYESTLSDSPSSISYTAWDKYTHSWSREQVLKLIK